MESNLPFPLLPVDQVRRELRRMVQANKRDMIRKLEDVLDKTKGIAATDDTKGGEARWLAFEDQMQSKIQDLDGLYEQLFAFIENAQFPKDSA